MTPFQAVTDQDPYRYYSQPRRQKDLHFDAELGVWVASGAAAVEAILSNHECRVRPLHEPVPPAIVQGAAGLFRPVDADERGRVAPVSQESDRARLGGGRDG